MQSLVLQGLDAFFFVFHTALIIFSATGWISKKVRGLHIAVLGVIFSFWFFAGIWYGWGYCPLTDWHWMIRAELGEPIHYETYFQLLIDAWFSVEVNRQPLDSIVVGIAVLSFCISSVLWGRNRWRGQKP